MTRPRLLLLGVLLAAVAAPASMRAQGQTPPRGARPALAPTGTAEVSVLVTTAGDPAEPLRHATVGLQAGELEVPFLGLTDDEGRVVFRELPAGSYSLLAIKPGYVRTYYGSAQPGRGPGTAVSVGDGQRIGALRLRMVRGSVITGVLRNAAGRPAPNQSVFAVAVRTVNGERQAIAASESIGMMGLADDSNRTVTTDDRGVYRIFGLPPGDYLVSVPAFGAGSSEVRQMIAAELAWADRAVAAGAAAAVSSEAPPPTPPVSYSPVYYPGTAVPADAIVISLGPGEERGGVDFAMQFVPTARVTGRVVDAAGRPQPALTVSLRPARPDALDLFSALTTSTGRTGQEGTFTIAGVKPGAYTLTVRAAVRDSNAATDLAAAARQAVASFSGGAAGLSHWASEDIVVQGRDVTDVTLALRPGSTVTGRIVYDATTRTPPADLSRAQISLTLSMRAAGSADPINALSGAGSLGATIAPDGRFTVTGVPPGRYRLASQQGLIPIPVQNVAVGGWTLRSAMAGGRDIVDVPIEIRSGQDVADVVVTFTDRPAELSGTVFDQNGRVTPSFPIVVFSTDRAYWTPSSRRVVMASPASDGRFRVVGLPAGEYYVCAVTMVSRSELYDASFLDALAPGAFKITIAEGEKKTQDLRLGGG